MHRSLHVVPLHYRCIIICLSLSLSSPPLSLSLSLPLSLSLSILCSPSLSLSLYLPLFLSLSILFSLSLPLSPSLSPNLSLHQVPVIHVVEGGYLCTTIISPCTRDSSSIVYTVLQSSSSNSTFLVSLLIHSSYPKCGLTLLVFRSHVRRYHPL